MDTMTACSPVTLKPHSVNRFSLVPSSVTLVCRLKDARLTYLFLFCCKENPFISCETYFCIVFLCARCDVMHLSGWHHSRRCDHVGGGKQKTTRCIFPKASKPKLQTCSNTRSRLTSTSLEVKMKGESSVDVSCKFDGLQVLYHDEMRI